jgi:hypothetical protein
MPATSESGQYIATGTPPLATAYISGPGVNVYKAIPSSPGRAVQFRAGVATIRDERDLIACLRDASVQVIVAPEYVEWIADRMNECGTAHPPQGELTLPAGWEVTGEPGYYSVFTTDSLLPDEFKEISWAPPSADPPSPQKTPAKRK